MADVFLASMKWNGQTELVALKRIRAESQDDPAFLVQFEREAQICSLLRHPNVVALRAFGRDPDGPFLALEFVDGCSAADLLDPHLSAEALPVPMIASVAADCAQALAYAHSYRQEAEGVFGIVHRDLSLENILLSREGIAKVADFGIARLIGKERLTRTGVVKGKLGYLAPEILRGGEVTPASDVFALGATLFALVCGVPAFPGATDAERMHATLYGDAPDPRKLRPSAPEALAAWISRALAKAPERRPTDFKALIAMDGQVPEIWAENRKAFAQRVRETSSGLASRRATVANHIVTSRRPKARWPFWAAGAAVLFVAVLATLSPRLRPPPAEPEAHASVVAAPAPTAPPASTQRHAEIQTPPPPRFTVKHGTTISRGGLPKRAPEQLSAAAAPTPDPAKGMLWIRVRPWAQVYLDGELQGSTPLEPIAVAAGAHAVRLLNEELNKDEQYTVRVAPHETKQLRVNLSPSPP
jgi:eukaryotic-like serine/threonine-protein kinase